MKYNALLIDADILIFKIAVANESAIEWDTDNTTYDTDIDTARQRVEETVANYILHFECSKVIMCLTDRDNWRKELNPSYKSNRKGVHKPVLLDELRQYLIDNYEVACWQTLEADDVMGILGVEIKDSLKISVDKDFATTPGYWVRPTDLGQVHSIAIENAFVNHMTQTLTGDSTDGYPGLPGVGKVKARKIISDCFNQDLNGDDPKYVDWFPKLWEAVVEAFESKGLTEKDAVLQARMAHILTPPYWDKEKEEVILWTPPERGGTE